MWKYNKYLQYPINIKKKDLKLAKCILTQYGGPYGELGAALRYLNQRYTMPDDKGKAELTDIATEEFGHVEMICTMVYQLTKDATIEELKADLQSMDKVDLVARIDGYLQKKHFKEGDFVKKGQLLFTIEPTQYLNNLNKAETIGKTRPRTGQIAG